MPRKAKEVAPTERHQKILQYGERFIQRISEVLYAKRKEAKEIGRESGVSRQIIAILMRGQPRDIGILTLMQVLDYCSKEEQIYILEGLLDNSRLQQRYYFQENEKYYETECLLRKVFQATTEEISAFNIFGFFENKTEKELLQEMINLRKK